MKIRKNLEKKNKKKNLGKNDRNFPEAYRGRKIFPGRSPETPLQNLGRTTLSKSVMDLPTKLTRLTPQFLKKPKQNKEKKHKIGDL